MSLRIKNAFLGVFLFCIVTTANAGEVSAPVSVSPPTRQYQAACDDAPPSHLSVPGPQKASVDTGSCRREQRLLLAEGACGSLGDMPTQVPVHGQDTVQGSLYFHLGAASTASVLEVSISALLVAK